ncbi:ATP-dependent nuclease [Hymenobacter properus]|uniref:AAA family ATPase n=1 Tax=Hymenobacter properus TaxID=2791026 RepID=A0A931BI69_9BACT|nr:AAA family ATPase [Hymenobacter properus]MBF9141802.1 AAA family ATPase [Hymenobacter properus]MBR7720610.1 AAA family ATPase [Microvirga sp. SRT04]
MYISKIDIKGFRIFKNTEVILNDGINVIIGHNNAGKTNLIKALLLVIDYQESKRLEIDDFNKNALLSDLQLSPPEITIQLTISQSKNENLNSDDLVTVSNWLTKLKAPYEAVLTYKFFLPEREKARYLKDVAAATDSNQVWHIVEHEFIRLYTYKIFCGDIKLQTTADSESLQKFDFQFLDAIRDVQRDMFTGKNALLKEVLDFFMDYEIKSDTTKVDADKTSEIKQKKSDFSNKANDLLKDLQLRMKNGKDQILSYTDNTGASFNKSNPNFEGSISDVEMFSALKLIVEYETGIKIPATHNGLGYNNLIYISLLLAKMQVNSDGKYLGSNAKVFSILAIEEPEAHLHPAMQYKFLNFLKENIQTSKKVRQIFITSHSTHITSTVSLDELICIHNENGDAKVGYPGKVFTDDAEGKKSKEYVQRFLDATKSDMLFAQKVILVEGLAEQLTISTFAAYIQKSLEDRHIVVINIGGRYFEHFLKIFDTLFTYTIPKKIACITDRDPERKAKANQIFTMCYPFEFNEDVTTYDYKDNASDSIIKYQNHPNIRFFSQDSREGKTLEYDLMLKNPTLDLIITSTTKNKSELKTLMTHYQNNSPLTDFISCLRASNENDRLVKSINANTSWNDNEKKKAIIASRYLNSVGKGENALELSYLLKENLKSGNSVGFEVPIYIQEAINWICQ